jgi:hypothetical protein
VSSLDNQQHTLAAYIPDLWITRTGSETSAKKEEDCISLKTKNTVCW